jgi:hypothetical protein
LRFRRKIRKVPGVFLNLSLNLSLAILKMRIALFFSEKPGLPGYSYTPLPYYPGISKKFLIFYFIY